jgi:2-polyprenyl-3-methyl-5-hydroxy-6-metoxy-1,4-benzoquinol methylase
MKVLNLGCGFCNRSKGEVGIDSDQTCKPNILWDLDKTPWPIDSGKFDKIVSIHVLEHLVNIVDVMNEAWRILKPGGTFFIRVPEYPTLGAIADPTHKRFFIPQSFSYFTSEGKLTGLKHIFKLMNLRVVKLTKDTNEIQCQLQK